MVLDDGQRHVKISEYVTASEEDAIGTWRGGPSQWRHFSYGSILFLCFNTNYIALLLQMCSSSLQPHHDGCLAYDRHAQVMCARAPTSSESKWCAFHEEMQASRLQSVTSSEKCVHLFSFFLPDFRRSFSRVINEGLILSKCSANRLRCQSSYKLSRRRMT